jgi:cobalt-zinc-cadmium efflux system membrane fusion protein
MHTTKSRAALGGMVLLSTLCVGCGPGAPSTTDAPAAVNASGAHSAWWCNEHGVPEEVCGQCNSKLAAEFQRKGDWCAMHDRPDSQCFACHPEFEVQFAARYEAKYGKKPPKPEG